jgi:4-diphosphocytidyl-2-C-methyl-D-erythritol kinase
MSTGLVIVTPFVRDQVSGVTLAPEHAGVKCRAFGHPCRHAYHAGGAGVACTRPHGKGRQRRLDRRFTADGPCVAVRVPAKVNLFLAVRGRRTDGYHEVVTVMQSLSVYDTLRVGVVGPPGQGHHPAGRRRMRVELWQDAADGLPRGEDNLAVQAARELARFTGIIDIATMSDGSREVPRTIIDLSKGIPVAGGWRAGPPTPRGRWWRSTSCGAASSARILVELAAELGSDVPFCVVGGTALATGRGTDFVRVLCRGTFHWVVCTAAEPLSTAAVYAAWDEHCTPSEVEPDAVLAAIAAGTPKRWAPPSTTTCSRRRGTCCPDLKPTARALLDAGALGAVCQRQRADAAGAAADPDEAQRIAAGVSGVGSRRCS